MMEDEYIIQLKRINDSYNGMSRMIIYVDGKNYGSVTSKEGEDLKALALEKFIKRKFMSRIRDLDVRELKESIPNDATDKKFRFAEGVLKELGYCFQYYKEGKSSVWYKMEKL